MLRVLRYAADKPWGVAERERGGKKRIQKYC